MNYDLAILASIWIILAIQAYKFGYWLGEKGIIGKHKVKG